jgi:hypothetical protein
MATKPSHGTFRLGSPGEFDTSFVANSPGALRSFGNHGEFGMSFMPDSPEAVRRISNKHWFLSPRTQTPPVNPKNGFTVATKPSHETSRPGSHGEFDTSFVANSPRDFR